MGNATWLGRGIAAGRGCDATKNVLLGSFTADRRSNFRVVSRQRLFWTVDHYGRTKRQKSATLTTASLPQVANEEVGKRSASFRRGCNPARGNGGHIARLYRLENRKAVRRNSVIIATWTARK